MPGHQRDCKACKRSTPHSSSGVYTNPKGEKCRNMICDFCGAITTIKVREEKDEGRGKGDEAGS